MKTALLTLSLLAAPAFAGGAEAFVRRAEAHAAAGEEGEAQLAWERARLLAPRDGRVRAATGEAGPPVLRELSPDEWTLLALGFGGVAAVGLLAAAWGARRRLPRVMLVAGGLASAASLVAAAAVAPSPDAAVVLQPAVARIAPFERADEAFAAREGSVVELEQEHGEWVRVSAPGGSGWLPKSAVERIVRTQSG